MRNIIFPFFIVFRIGRYNCLTYGIGIIAFRLDILRAFKYYIGMNIGTTTKETEMKNANSEAVQDAMELMDQAFDLIDGLNIEKSWTYNELCKAMGKAGVGLADLHKEVM